MPCVRRQRTTLSRQALHKCVVVGVEREGLYAERHSQIVSDRFRSQYGHGYRSEPVWDGCLRLCSCPKGVGLTTWKLSYGYCFPSYYRPGSCRLAIVFLPATVFLALKRLSLAFRLACRALSTAATNSLRNTSITAVLPEPSGPLVDGMFTIFVVKFLQSYVPSYGTAQVHCCGETFRDRHG